MSSGRVSFSPEFREQMVELFLSYKGQKNLSQVARENGIGAETLRNWVKKYQEANPVEDKPLTISERARLEQLERENQELRLERGSSWEKPPPSSRRSIGSRPVRTHSRGEGDHEFGWFRPIHGGRYVYLAGRVGIRVL